MYTRIPQLSNIDYVVNEGRRMLAKPKGAVGRGLRRFVKQHADIARVGRPQGDGKFELQVTLKLHQVFCQQAGFTDVQLAAVEAYAKQVFEKNKAFFPEGAHFDNAETVCVAESCLVRNTYELKLDPDTASVAVLRMLVEVQVALMNNLRDIAKNINAYVLHDVEPDYVYRGLPCSEATWSIGGNGPRDGSGVLEWCYDLEDAKQVLDRMRRQPARFLSLTIYDDNMKAVAA